MTILEKNNHLESLLRDIPEKTIYDSTNDLFVEVQSFFEGELSYIERRCSDKITLSFCTWHPEYNVYIIYSPSNQLRFLETHSILLDEYDNAIRKKIQLDGYIACERIVEKWFFVEIYNPT